MGELPIFGFTLNLAIGLADREGEDSFELLVASPTYLAHYYATRMPIFLRHVLLVADYDVSMAVAQVHKYVGSLEENNWLELATKINRMARWEFEGYQS